MKPYYSDEHLTILEGDAAAVLATLEPASVHCVVTSPPYWGLRDYGTATWVGGDEGCDHRIFAYPPGTPTPGGRGGTMPMQEEVQRSRCRLCGAVRQDSQLGLEATPEAYVEALVGVFREVRRVLRDDGTVWLNLGDSYAANGVSGLSVKGDTSTLVGTSNGAHTAQVKSVPFGLKPKDLVGIPWRVAFALQADGWYLRSDIIWSKPNPMPESVTDRPTKSHEYLFLLSKSARYYFDAEAVRRPISPYNDGRVSVAPHDGNTGRVLSEGHRKNEWREYDEIKGANVRTVWEIATQPYPGAHFATFPQKLVEPCVKAGCPEGGVVLDPFAGTGTVGLVAQNLGRRAFLVDLNAEYLRQCLGRNRQVPLGLMASVGEPQR